MYHLQTRWKLEDGGLYYYGLRNKERMFKNLVKITREQRGIIQTLPCDLTEPQKAALGPLLGVQVVTEEDLRPLPTSLREARFCTQCCANDFILPGLEFDVRAAVPSVRRRMASSWPIRPGRRWLIWNLSSMSPAARYGPGPWEFPLRS